MKKHAAQNELEKAEGAIKVAAERLEVIEGRLPELEKELEGLLVEDEIRGYKKAAITRSQNTITKLKAEKEIVEKTISALRKRLPDLERAARIETASTETAGAYQEAFDQFKALFDNVPPFDAIVEGIEALESHMGELAQAQEKYHKLARGLNAVMLSEGITSAGEITIDRLFSDKNDIPYGKLFAVSEALTAITNRISGLQNSISTVKDFNRLFFKLERPIEAAPEPEYSADEKYKRAWVMGYWRLYEKRMKSADNSFMLKPTWVEIGYGINKPSFPSDQAPKRKPQPQKAEAEQVRTGMSQLYPVAAGKMKDPDAGRSV
jgi:archaellum component FlaC